MWRWRRKAFWGWENGGKEGGETQRRPGGCEHLMLLKRIQFSSQHSHSGSQQPVAPDPGTQCLFLAPLHPSPTPRMQLMQKKKPLKIDYRKISSYGIFSSLWVEPLDDIDALQVFIICLFCVYCGGVMYLGVLVEIREQLCVVSSLLETEVRLLSLVSSALILVLVKTPWPEASSWKKEFILVYGSRGVRSHCGREAR